MLRMGKIEREAEFVCGSRHVYIYIDIDAICIWLVLPINWQNKLDDADDDDKIIMQYFI